MHDLIAITPLGGHEPRHDHHQGHDLTEVTDVALASVAARLGQEAASAALVAEVTGAEAPAPGRASASAFWMGPDQWMVEAPIATREDLAHEIAAKAQGKASVTEQTDAWCRFDLKGDRLWDVLERLCNADVRRFTGGEAIRTAIEHLGCFLVVRAPGHVSVIGPRSSAGSLYHALLTAMRSAL
ncbi:sarcosine oxidase subunit gamma [Ponticoccus alexandrii]|uniref:Sarcosine oxidase subunit gamma n=1 Tax=Ponticoccus alexandrii TaxID=1943633 RepID=A0ABX7FE55_9RHOB|nr:sarcosine oxidase subunit gamma [Ponticoccus alexandrii]ETA51746.2 sarcosine oxidase subunit gamma [Rhodobacteraceae bacterium PD-2]QRF68841.1 sarcosine oxidase subunit gamma [Ponticoccus alexandrii]